MPDDQTPSPAADAQASAPVATAPQPAPSFSINPSDMFGFSKIFEGSDIPVGDPDEGGVSNGEATPPAAPAEAKASDDKPAPESPEGVKASDAPGPGSEPPASTDAPTDPEKPLSRREQERQENERTIADLRAQLAERDSPAYRDKLRQEARDEIQRQQAETVDEDFLGNQERFERLKAQPYSSLSDEDVAWLDLRESRRQEYAPVERHFRAIYDRKLAEANRTVEQREKARADRAVAEGWERINADLGTQIEATSKLPGVDPSVFTAEGANWQSMGEHLHAAGAASKESELAERITKAESEVARLTKLLEEKQADSIADRRLPATIGRSAGAAPGNGFDPSVSWQDNLAAAFGTNGTG